MKRLSLSVCILVASTLTAQSDDMDKYRPEPAGPQSDFDRAMKEAPDKAREPKEYNPPDPHEGCLKIDKDVSVGGKIDPPEVNVRTTIP